MKTMRHGFIAFMDRPPIPTAFTHQALVFQQYKERFSQSLKCRQASSDGLLCQ